MVRVTKYRTRQREEILDYMRSLNGDHVTAANIAAHFMKTDSPIGLTTIYRQLDSLVKEGDIQKYFLGEGESACYAFNSTGNECREHFHLKCEKCGKLFHVECDELSLLKDHLETDHGFVIDSLKTVFYGSCQDCASHNK